MNDDVMVSKTTGHVLQVASSDFFIDERGMLTSRVLADGDMNSNVTIDGARRRLLSEVVALGGGACGPSCRLVTDRLGHHLLC